MKLIEKDGKEGVLKIRRSIDNKFETYINNLPPFAQKVMREDKGRDAWERNDGFDCPTTLLASPLVHIVETLTVLTQSSVGLSDNRTPLKLNNRSYGFDL